MTMIKKTPTDAANILAEEISNRLVQINHDMLIAEKEENYSQAALIQTTLHLYIANASQILADKTNGSVKQIYDGLIENSNHIFEQMKLNESKIF